MPILPTTQSHVVLEQRPAGPVRPANFRLARASVPKPAAGEALLQLEWLSMDPYLRGVIAGRHLGHRIEPGDRIPGLGVARVIEAPDDSAVAPGDHVVTDCGWCEYLARPAAQLQPLSLPADIPVPKALGILGMPGLTAWAGLHRLATIRPGQTVVTSAASGTVGAAVIQLASAHGCRTVGVTGAAKRTYVSETLQADVVVDRDAALAERLAGACPDGIDVYFDNVGGQVLETAIHQLALGARIILCGMIDQYQLEERPPGPNLAPLIAARASMHGLVVYDHFDAMSEFLDEAVPLYRSGRLACRETIYEGLAQAPKAFCDLMSGKGHGKHLVRLNHDE